jgi:hypothetical protein
MAQTLNTLAILQLIFCHLTLKQALELSLLMDDPGKASFHHTSSQISDIHSSLI